MVRRRNSAGLVAAEPAVSMSSHECVESIDQRDGEKFEDTRQSPYAAQRSQDVDDGTPFERMRSVGVP